MIDLPEAFKARMRTMLKEEYGAFIESYDRSRPGGLRINSMKTDKEEFARLFPDGYRRIPWTTNGYFYEENLRPSQHPLYQTGLYYLQEPSAMAPAQYLRVCPGDRVLDLCAAPGGKSTELAARLGGSGTLVSNDISASRTKALLYNLELFGTTNAFVTNEKPANLRRVFGAWFDKILVDAPCSGEGMFRKSPEVLKSWDAARPAYFANIQRDIVLQAADMLKPGGLMMYSTCTFSPEEDEGTISRLLKERPEMEVVGITPYYEGFCPGNPAFADGTGALAKTVRIWPHVMDGEGHFLALLRKKEGMGAERETERNWKPKSPSKEELKLFEAFITDTGIRLPAALQSGKAGSLPEQGGECAARRAAHESEELYRHLDARNGKLFLTPLLPQGVESLHFVRNGLFLGEFKKNRFEPAQAFAMALGERTCGECVNFPADDERVSRYRKGESLQLSEAEATGRNGWKLLCVEGKALGWAKKVNSQLKNKYLAAWRKA